MTKPRLFAYTSFAIAALGVWSMFHGQPQGGWLYGLGTIIGIIILMYSKGEQH
jgi:hypothetical protein